MTYGDVLKILAKKSDTRLVDTLASASFDELIEINIATGEFRHLSHVYNKYAATVTEGDFPRLYRYALEHFIHPEDRDSYRGTLDLTTIRQRLAQADPAGVLTGAFRFFGTDGQYVRTFQLIIHGPILGLPQDVLRIYVYDLDNPRGPEKPDRVHREEVTGLMEGLDYFRAARDILPGPEAGWCMVSVDIEHYKLFVDWYGLESGNYLLNRIGSMLQEIETETGGLGGYLGQDQFAILMPYDRPRIEALYENMAQLVSSVSLIDGFQPIFGIALIDGSCTRIREYYNHAALTAEEAHDTANRICLYDTQLHQRNSSEYRLLYEFQSALQKGEITFYLQPQCRVSNRRIVGAEALARWIKADGTLVPPSDFVPVLEKYRVVDKLDTYIWDAVCRWLHDRREQGLSTVPVSLNVSRIDVAAMDVAEHMAGLLKKYDLPADCLEAEITESAYAEGTDAVQAMVDKLRAMGMRVLMDDFGSGYSSLNMLRRLVVDAIKLDARFLDLEKGEQKKGVSILESVIHMTKTLGTPIIVEGVETVSQIRYLTEMGCGYVQGFLFHKPMPRHAFEALLADPRRLDSRGLLFRPNQQLQVREFLDENLFNDAMLNNVLGAVVFYNWTYDDNIDIVRFNEQFFHLVGVSEEEFANRRFHIQELMPREDQDKMFSLFREAMEHRVLGAAGLIRSYRPNGVIVWLSLHLYFMDEDASGRRFYASARDVTELQFLNSDLPGGYFRCSTDDKMEFLFVSENFQRMTGYTEEELAQEFDNTLVSMIHPMDLPRVQEDCQAIISGTGDAIRPYRIRSRTPRAVDGYIYVADNSRISDRFGILCWQSIVIDVTDVMTQRNRMRILWRHLPMNLYFLRRNKAGGWNWETITGGLSRELGWRNAVLEEGLNSGEIRSRISGFEDVPPEKLTDEMLRHMKGRGVRATILGADDKPVLTVASAEPVAGEPSGVEYIVSLRKAYNQNADDSEKRTEE